MAMINVAWTAVVFGGLFVINPWLGVAVALATVAIYLAGLWRFDRARRGA
jgi:hypothetical protein